MQKILWFCCFREQSVHLMLLRETMQYITHPLTLILVFQQSMEPEESTVPDDWKKASVTPIYKNGINRRQKVADQYH